MPNRQSKYRDKEKARNTYHEQKKRYYESRRFGDGKRHQWTIREIEIILRHEKTDTELAKEIGTSVGAVQSMRHCCKRKDQNDAKKRDL